MRPVPDPWTIHIVDDEEAVRESLAFLLTVSGHFVRTYASPVSLLEQAQALGNGCLITDLGMPGMDGLTLIRRLREVNVDLPAIIMTGHGDTQSLSLSARHGVVGVLGKTFSDEQVLELLQRAEAAADTQKNSSWT